MSGDVGESPDIPRHDTPTCRGVGVSGPTLVTPSPESAPDASGDFPTRRRRRRRVADADASGTPTGSANLPLTNWACSGMGKARVVIYIIHVYVYTYTYTCMYKAASPCISCITPSVIGVTTRPPLPISRQRAPAWARCAPALPAGGRSLSTCHHHHGRQGAGRDTW